MTGPKPSPKKFAADATRVAGDSTSKDYAKSASEHEKSRRIGSGFAEAARQDKKADAAKTREEAAGERVMKQLKGTKLGGQVKTKGSLPSMRYC